MLPENPDAWQDGRQNLAAIAEEVVGFLLLIVAAVARG